MLYDLAESALTSLARHRLRSFVVVCCLVVTIVPYVALSAIAAALQRDARISLAEGADLYVSASEFGEPMSVPIGAVEDVLAIDGVEAVAPRVVGRVTLGKENVEAIVVGVAADRLLPQTKCVNGRLAQPGPALELALGSQLARRLRLKPGDYIPPFYQSRGGDRVGKVVGVFESQVSVWESNVMLTSIDRAAEIFDDPGRATELLVWCRPGYSDAVRGQILRTLAFDAAERRSADADGEDARVGGRQLRPLVVAKSDLQAGIPAGMAYREGIFQGLFLIAFVCAMLVVLVTSGIGLSERRREIGILKAIGWQTDTLLLRASLESLILALLASCVSLLLAYFWLAEGGGRGIDALLLPGRDGASPAPYLLFPTPTLLAFGVSTVVVMTGTLVSTWRAAIASPSVAMRS